MNNNLAQLAVMNLEEGEEILTGLASPHIPQVGIYNLLAKKRTDGTIEWAHFVQRDNGLKEKVMRGTVSSLFPRRVRGRGRGRERQPAPGLRCHHAARRLRRPHPEWNEGF